MKHLQRVGDGLTYFLLGSITLGVGGIILSLAIFGLFGVSPQIATSNPPALLSAWVCLIVFSFPALAICVLPYNLFVVGTIMYDSIQKRRAAHVQH